MATQSPASGPSRWPFVDDDDDDDDDGDDGEAHDHHGDGDHEQA